MEKPSLKATTAYLLWIGQAILLSSCTPAMTRPAEDSYRFSVIDNVEQRRFDISLVSYDDRALCVSIQDWPGSDGQFAVEGTDALLESDAGLLPARYEFGCLYCPGGCGQHRVEPRGELRGFISYQAFGDPEQLVAQSIRQLRFKPVVNYCY